MMVEEVQQHIQEMLDGGAIHPSESPWCNVVVIIRKKDGLLQFCIDFHKLNERTKKDVYPLPHMQEQMESMVGARHFSCIDLKNSFLQVKMAEGESPIHCIHHWEHGDIQVSTNAVWLV